MRASDYKKDLEYLYSMLLKHPSILEDEKRKAAFEDIYLKYTNVKAYRRYEVIDYSSGAARRVTNRNDVIENMQEEVLFPEQIFCKVSHNTFSSARTFAVTLKDNGIAKVYGNETGGKPNSYGMPEKMCMAKTNIRFRVSRGLFLRPDAALDDRITLMPEVKKVK